MGSSIDGKRPSVAAWRGRTARGKRAASHWAWRETRPEVLAAVNQRFDARRPEREAAISRAAERLGRARTG